MQSALSTALLRTSVHSGQARSDGTEVTASSVSNRRVRIVSSVLDPSLYRQLLLVGVGMTQVDSATVRCSSGGWRPVIMTSVVGRSNGRCHHQSTTPVRLRSAHHLRDLPVCCAISTKVPISEQTLQWRILGEGQSSHAPLTPQNWHRYHTY